MEERPDHYSAEIEVSKLVGSLCKRLVKVWTPQSKLMNFYLNSGVMKIPRALVSLLRGNWIIAKQIENVINVQKRLH